MPWHGLRLFRITFDFPASCSPSPGVTLFQHHRPPIRARPPALQPVLRFFSLPGLFLLQLHLMNCYTHTFKAQVQWHFPSGAFLDLPR